MAAQEEHTRLQEEHTRLILPAAEPGALPGVMPLAEPLLASHRPVSGIKEKHGIGICVESIEQPHHCKSAV